MGQPGRVPGSGARRREGTGVQRESDTQSPCVLAAVPGMHVAVLPDGFLELGRVSPPPSSPQCPLLPRGQRLPCSSRLPPLVLGVPLRNRAPFSPEGCRGLA